MDPLKLLDYIVRNGQAIADAPLPFVAGLALAGTIGFGLARMLVRERIRAMERQIETCKQHVALLRETLDLERRHPPSNEV
jgi:high-affinity Fe2+/Pb2+ permease